MKPEDVFKDFNFQLLPEDKEAFMNGSLICYFEESNRWRGAFVKYKNKYYKYAKNMDYIKGGKNFIAISDDIKYIFELFDSWKNWNIKCIIVDEKLYAEFTDTKIIEAI